MEVKGSFGVEYEKMREQFECRLDDSRDVKDSELCMYEFDDIAWDGFYQSDQIALRPSSKRSGDHITMGDNHTKHGSELTTISSDTGDRTSGFVYQEREQETFFNSSKRRNKMSRKDSWSDAPTGFYDSSSDIDFIKKESSLAFDNHRSNNSFMSSNTDLHDDDICLNDAIYGKSNALDSSSFTYPLAGITQTGSNLHLSGISENKDASDFRSCSWPEIGNFEDVDRMFRNCDSTFGITASSEDELGWFSSADDVRFSGTLLNSDLKSPSAEPNVVENISENDDFLKGYSIDASAFTSAAPCGRRDSSCTSEKSSSYISFTRGQPNIDKMDGCMPGEQINDHIKQFKPQNQSDGKSKEHYFGSYHVSSLSNESTDISSGHTSNQAFRSVDLQPEQLSPGHSSNQISYMHSDETHSSDLASVNPIPYSVKSEPNDVTLLSQSRSSYAQHLDNSQSVHGVSVPRYEEREKFHNHQVSPCCATNNLKDGSVMVRGSKCNSGSQKHEYHSDSGEVTLVVPSESGPANIQKRSTTNSGLDDISVEAVSFHRLQLVMERLDSGTKLCMRDSLYRLAQSAELRHNHANQNGSHEDDSGGGLTVERRNKFATFTNIERDTNPLDRSIAHLLFHKPQDSSPMATPASQLVSSSMASSRCTCR